MSSLPDRILCLVTDLDRAGNENNLLRAVREAVRGGVNLVQVRAHELDEVSLTRLAETVIDAIDDKALVMVNGSIDVAQESGADGIHVRESGQIDRPTVGSGLLVGQSVHSIEAARAAQTSGVDYIILGTVFPSRSHPGGATGGTELVASVAREISIPIIGIGGITADNAAEVVVAGASGVAVIGAIIGSKDPFEAAKVLAGAIGLT